MTTKYISRLTRSLALALCLLLFFYSTTSLLAQNTNSPSIALKVTGEKTTLGLSLEQLAALPQRSVSVHDKSGHLHMYTGVYVQDVLTKAGVTMGTQLHGKNLSKYVLATCADGYQVVYSLAELDSSIVRNPPIIAYRIDGKPLFNTKGPLRIIMPTDKKQARSCYQLRALSVHFARE